jgi:N4-(beta-N-acetylglucosaminyl)-L-asparaginase
MSDTRRGFLKKAAAIGVGGLAASHVGSGFPHVPVPQRAGGLLAVSSANGLRALETVMGVLRTGADALDAVIAGVNIVENDPEDTSVGYGGLPNEEGVVELDAAVMHGPTHRAGAVAALRNIKTPSKVARLVMERTDHVLLVAEGALRFAKAHGFKEEDLLTDKAREEWLRWKEHASPKDDWLPPHNETDKDIGSVFEPFRRHTGTIHCSAIDARGNLSCVTSTSGLSYKIPGRVGDSPIVGAGLYVDNEVGSAGSTGRGEANLINCSSFLVVEFMRRGKTPEEACLEVCRRIVDHNKLARLKGEDGRPNFDVKFYAIGKDGGFGAASILSGATMAVHDGTGARLVEAAYLYKR